MKYKGVDTTKVVETFHHKKEGWTSYRMNDDKVVRLQPDEVEELNRLCPTPVGAFMDGSCTKCKKRFGWTGKIIDRPPCPKCGHQINLEELKEDEKAIKAFEELLRMKKQEREDNDD